MQAAPPKKAPEEGEGEEGAEEAEPAEAIPQPNPDHAALMERVRTPDSENEPIDLPLEGDSDEEFTQIEIKERVKEFIAENKG